MANYEDLIKPGLFGNSAYADTRREEFDIKNGTVFVNDIPVDICFIGDSITHFWETNSFFSEYGTVINRGIGGDMAHIMVKRFDADVLQLKPKVAVVLIGFNNMLCLKEFEDKTTPEFHAKEQEVFDLIVSCWNEIIDKCEAANQKLIMCTLTPTLWPPEINNLIFKVNEKLRKICCERNILLADYNASLLDAEGDKMSWDYSVDGTHPNGYGYRLMSGILKPELDKILKRED